MTQVAETISDSQGRFEIRLKPGVYQVVALGQGLSIPRMIAVIAGKMARIELHCTVIHC
jgi:hypothetical protein